jgi:RND family efflux transporter MFP subunit
MSAASKWKVLLPLIVLALGALAAIALFAARPAVSTAPPASQPPLVRAVVAKPENLQLRVRTHGTVQPRTESSLIPEVSGRVTWVSPHLAAGGFFEAGEVLLRIDAEDHAVALEAARAALARRESEAKLAAAQLGRARSLSGQGVVSAAELDEAENLAHVARAAEREAKTALKQAEMNLERTELRAPFTGRVRQEQVDPGQFVVRGAPVATLYAVDYAEIRLPVPDGELRFLDLPLAHGGDSGATARPDVVLRAVFAGETREWRGTVVRTEGEIDPRTRMVNVVAQVDDPYAREHPDTPPLAVGLFVEAEILGRPAEGVFVLPREAMRGPNRIYVVDGEGRLRFRSVDVLRADHENVVVRSGLSAGELVCISPLEAVTDGMSVRVQGQNRPASPAVEPAGA